MTPEQKAALERLRNSATPWYSGMTLDYIKVAYLWLSEHPADDDEPVTEEWLQKVIAPDRTARLGGGFSVTFYATQTPTLSYYNSGIGGWYDDSSDIDVPKASTRGDVRRLCRALGIELKE